MPVRRSRLLPQAVRGLLHGRRADRRRRSKDDSWRTSREHAREFDVVVVDGFRPRAGDPGRGRRAVARGPLPRHQRPDRTAPTRGSTSSPSTPAPTTSASTRPRRGSPCTTSTATSSHVAAELLPARVACRADDPHPRTQRLRHLGSPDRARARHPRLHPPRALDTMGAGDAFLAVTSPLVATGARPMELVGFIGNAVGAMKVGDRRPPPLGREGAADEVHLQTLLK